MARSTPLRVGFIPVYDCAPVVVARESGLFEKYELQVELQRETRWADIRDAVINGELDAAHAPATLPFVTNLGLDSDQCACVSGLVLSLQGNAITVSRQLWDEGVRDASSFRALIYSKWGRRTYSFGVVFPYSAQYFLLHRWLKSGEITPNADVRIVVVPPAQMFPMLKLGYLDGFCCGEPWGAIAEEDGAGVCIATSSWLAQKHPEKVLMVRRDFADQRVSEHERLIAALVEACAFCDRAENRPLLAEILAQPRYVNAPSECLLRDSGDSPDQIAGTSGRSSIFFRHHANDPTDDKAEWVIGQLYEIMEQRVLQLPKMPPRTPMVKNVFRRDIFERATRALAAQAKTMEDEARNFAA